MKLLTATTDAAVFNNAVILATAADMAYFPEAEGQKRSGTNLDFPLQASLVSAIRRRFWLRTTSS